MERAPMRSSLAEMGLASDPKQLVATFLSPRLTGRKGIRSRHRYGGVGVQAVSAIERGINAQHVPTQLE